jgi:hypothetical protein
MIPETDLGVLDDHEKAVMKLLLERVEGNVQGFPDSMRKLYNVVRAWARFMDLTPHHNKFIPEVLANMTAEEKERFAWKEGVVPGEWLIQQICDSCEWMPAPVVAREIYLGGGFRPLDGLTLDKLSQVGRRVRRADSGDSDL